MVTGIMLLTIVAWVVCVVWVAVHAQRCAISLVFWPLAILLSGPLGLVAYGVVRNLAAERR
jgi:hypothetical protein